MSKLIVGIVLSFVIGTVWRYFDVPIPSPPKLAGAVIVVAMTLGYVMVDQMLVKDPATTAELCGGPTGKTAAQRDR